jgi:hypothetical protein
VICGANDATPGSTSWSVTDFGTLNSTVHVPG